MKELFESLEQIIEKIKGFISIGEVNAAKRLLGIIENKFENTPEILTLQSVILILEGNYGKAKERLTEELIHFPFNQDIIFNLAYVNEIQGDFEEAYYQYNDVLKIGDEFAKKDASEKIDLLKGKFDLQIGMLKNIVFFVREGLDNFIDDIIKSLSNDYRTKIVIVTSYEQIDQGMEWADICWFEWCDELIIYASTLQVAQRKKVICRLHSYEAFTNYTSQVNWKAIDNVIFVAEHIKQYVLENEKSLSEKQIIVIPNGIDLDKYTFKEREPGFNIAHIGYINYKKGPMLLLHAFKAIYDYDNRYKLYIAGEFQDPRYVLYYEQMTKEMGLEKNVFIEGWQEDIDEWLEDKHFILSSSVLESQHLSMMEAMAKGIKPLVHNFVGAKNVYDKKFIWSTINQLLDNITSNDYNSSEYYSFIEERYSLENQIKEMKNMLLSNVDLSIKE